jgi:hypothetical protein
MIVGLSLRYVGITRSGCGRVILPTVFGPVPSSIFLVGNTISFVLRRQASSLFHPLTLPLRLLIPQGKVYDVTDFLDMHPGGAEIILANAGKDAT